jgi:putative Ca2+/H+ antiporter (TMEM165/GDT1 family)
MLARTFFTMVPGTYVLIDQKFTAADSAGTGRCDRAGRHRILLLLPLNLDRDRNSPDCGRRASDGRSSPGVGPSGGGRWLRVTGFVEIVVVAAVAQLAVLPGEKVQFIIAGLSTRYPPLLVVGAAGSAFAGWTVLEILFGRAVQRALPGVALDAITAALFVLFAVLLVTSAPDGTESGATDTETDGGVADAAPAVDGEVTLLGYTVEGPVGDFLSIFSMMAAGEFGDKTQLVTIGLAVQYGATPAIWLGEMLAILPVSLANALLAHRFDRRTAHYVGATLFAFFGADAVVSIATGFSVWETAVGAVSDVVVGTL